MTKPTLYEPDYPLSYQGDDGNGLMYGDYVRIVQDLPHGSVLNGHTYIGAWCVIEEYMNNDRYAVPRSMVACRLKLAELERERRAQLATLGLS